MKCVDRWACVVITPLWLVITLVATVCTFSEGLKWTLEKVVSADVGWADGQGQAVCGLIGLDGILLYSWACCVAL